MLECTVDCHFDGDINPTTEMVLYRVAQEALTNVVKHATAHWAQVTLDRRDGPILLEVSGDGAGLDPVAARHLTGP